MQISVSILTVFLMPSLCPCKLTNSGFGSIWGVGQLTNTVGACRRVFITVAMCQLTNLLVSCCP